MTTAPPWHGPPPLAVVVDLDDTLYPQAAYLAGAAADVGAAAAAAGLDGDRVHAALLRLVRNAAQVSPPGAELRIGSRLDGDAVELYVADDGPGLPDELAATVLERHTSTSSGPGLGLAVVRAVADAHEGSAWVETAVGEGSTFGLRLPVRRAPEEPTPYEVGAPEAPAGVAA